MLWTSYQLLDNGSVGRTAADARIESEKAKNKKARRKCY